MKVVISGGKIQRVWVRGSEGGAVPPRRDAAQPELPNAAARQSRGEGQTDRQTDRDGQSRHEWTPSRSSGMSGSLPRRFGAALPVSSTPSPLLCLQEETAAFIIHLSAGETAPKRSFLPPKPSGSRVGINRTLSAEHQNAPKMIFHLSCQADLHSSDNNCRG